MLLKTKHYIGIILLFVAVIVTIFVGNGYVGKLYQSFSDWMGNIDSEYYEKMKSIQVGMDKSEVISLLDEPSLVSKEPEIIETHGQFGSGRNYGTKIKNKNECLIYHHGNDIIGHYFIDEKGKVYFVNVGGT